MENRKVRILDASDIYYNKFFDFLSQEEKLEIYDNVRNKKSIIIGVEEIEFEVLAVSVIDLHGDSIHVRRVAGDFVKNIFCIDSFTYALAKFLKKAKVTYNDNVKMKTFIKRIGFSFDGNEYVKEVI